MQKKGLSTIVTTLIIIVLVLVAIGIVWIVVRNVIQTGTEGVSLNQFTLNAEIMNVDADNVSDNINLTVKRNPGEGEITKIKFIFSTETDSEIVTEEVSLKELEERRFNFHLTKVHVSDLVSISIVPIMKQNEKEILGNVADKYTFGKGKKTQQTQACNPKTCVSLGYNCGTWTNGTCYDTQNINCNAPGCGTHATCPSGTCVCDSNWQDCNNDNICECDLSLNTCSGGSCVVNPICTPATCASLNYNCGNWTDGCSGTLSCGVFGNGSCQTGQTCVWGSCVSNTSVLCGPSRTYYIDYANGNDNNNGTCSNSAWKRQPYMSGFSGSYTHYAGDRFIFKGGIIWPSNALPLLIAGIRGNSSNYDYYGVDKRWYSGSSWSRPVFDGERKSNGIISLTRPDMIVPAFMIFDNLELRGLLVNSSSPYMITSIGGLGKNITINNSYIHGWYIGELTTTDNSFGGVNFGGWDANSNPTGNILANSEVSGADCNKNGGELAYRVETILNSTLHDTPNAILGCCNVIGSRIYNVNLGYDTTSHPNAIYIWASGNCTLRDNLLYNIGSAMTMYLYPSNGSTIYAYNNIIYNVSRGIGIEVDPDFSGPGSDVGNTTARVFLYSNTIDAGLCVRMVPEPSTINTLAVMDNHCIGGQLISWGVIPPNINVSNNLLESKANATKEGYTVSNLFAPINATAPTVNAGISLSNLFTTDINGVTRPQGSAWDIGAYEYV